MRNLISNYSGKWKKKNFVQLPLLNVNWRESSDLEPVGGVGVRSAVLGGANWGESGLKGSLELECCDAECRLACWSLDGWTAGAPLAELGRDGWTWFGGSGPALS